MNLENITFKISNGSIEDFFLLREIHKTSMLNNVIDCIGEWNEEYQVQRLEKHFKESFQTLEFILLNNEVIGTINSRHKKYENEEFHFIEQFYLLPKVQGLGLGSFLLNHKMNEKKLKTRLSVLKKDTKTHKFYYKNGFVEYQEDEYQKYMEKTVKVEDKILEFSHNN